MKTIEQTIQFAIDNGYKETTYCKYIKKWYKIHSKEAKLIYMVTSKEYIEALARGLLKTQKESIWRLESTIDRITTTQAIAIRDNKLEEYYKELLNLN